MNKYLTNQKYWNSTYQKRNELVPASISGFKNHFAKIIYNKKIKYLQDAKTVLEIGGGASAWLAFLSRKYPEKQFVSIDYSVDGSDQLKCFLEREEISNVDVVIGDFFEDSSFHSLFDFVYSHGVAEHFSELSDVLRAHSSFLNESGKMLTIIPNMAGLLGIMTRLMNKEVYDLHVAHDLESFQNGHIAAGLHVIDSGYLCSNNFGVLSSCVRIDSGSMFQLYKSLSRLSKAIWWFEDKFLDLPVTKSFSPYIFVLSARS